MLTKESTKNMRKFHLLSNVYNEEDSSSVK